MANRFYFRFLPLAIFDAGARSKGLGSTWSAAIALGVAVAIALPSVRDRRITGLEVGVVVIFALICSVGMTLGSLGGLEVYSRAFAASGFGAIALGSLLLTPISYPYTKDLVPRTLWRRAIFKEVNLKVSSAWGVVFIAIAFSNVIGEAFGSSLAITLGEWLVPIFLTVIGCSFTERCIVRELDLDMASI